MGRFARLKIKRIAVFTLATFAGFVAYSTFETRVKGAFLYTQPVLQAHVKENWEPKLKAAGVHSVFLVCTSGHLEIKVRHPWSNEDTAASPTACSEQDSVLVAITQNKDLSYQVGSLHYYQPQLIDAELQRIEQSVLAQRTGF